jgi:hypothetical protein
LQQHRIVVPVPAEGMAAPHSWEEVPAAEVLDSQLALLLYIR